MEGRREPGDAGEIRMVLGIGVMVLVWLVTLVAWRRWRRWVQGR